MNCTCGDCLACDLRNMGRLEPSDPQAPRVPMLLRLAGRQLQREIIKQEKCWRANTNARRAGKV